MDDHALPMQDREALNRLDLERCRQMERNGSARGASIVGPPECAAAQDRRGRVYAPDRVPALPLPDCALEECRCRYEPARK
ncbi:MAG TPA: hypothetical protein VEI03_03860 [Stellaceae bacterium]|nr:hypothetical protein [Stellaceae bacterium]